MATAMPIDLGRQVAVTVELEAKDLTRLGLVYHMETTKFQRFWAVMEAPASSLSSVDMEEDG